MHSHAIRAALMLGVGAIALAAPAHAQDAAEVDADKEIVVTAQNRVQNVQDVPIAIQVVSGEDVEKAGISDLTGIQRLAPAVQITNDTNLTRVTLRGIGTNDNAETQDASIVVNIDGEYINRPTVMNASLFDLERVEVLRGPQGTLQGRNATGGAVNFITRKPGDDFGFNLAASYGNFDHVLVQGGVDLPIGDIGGIRFSGTYSKRDGFFRHPNVNVRTGNDNSRAGRVSLHLNPIDPLTIDLAFEVSAVNNIIAGNAFVNFNNGLGFNANFVPGPGCNQNGWARIGADPRFVVCIPQNTNALASIDRKNYVTSARAPSRNEQDSKVVRGKIAYDFDGATLTYTGGYRRTDEKFDAALTPAFLFKNFANDVETQSHELRLNGGSPGSFEWQFGGFYFKEDLFIERGLFNGPPFLPAFLTGANGAFINYFRRDVSSRSYSAFGQVDIPITEELSVTAGARYTDDSRTGIFPFYPGGLGNPSSPLFNTGIRRITAAPQRTDILRAKADKVTWLLGLNYKPDTDTLLYAKVSTGFKAGGFDTIGQYAPETNTAYEAGIKKSFGPSTINFSGFYYDYKDLQASVLLDNTIGGQVFNAGGATIWGLELDASIKVFDAGRFTASINYLSSEYDDFLASYAVFCASETHPTLGCLTGLGDLDNDITTNPVVQPNLAGNRTPLAPKWVVAAGYEHVFDLGSAGTLTPSIFTRFKSSYFMDVFNFRDSRQSGFFQTDATLEWRDETGKFGIQLFARNLEDNQPLTYAAFTAAGNDDIYNWQFSAPRTYGVRMLLDF
ncbi:TonB-dependent receptor [Blastomonas sp. UPD001]|uniref:TonB-dependent receptor n=1 Tax=Blastomonas sp. UPD001 TaxID=2217673 RepID=UPI000E347915|nr:TonB-dependent receptor [Blastomonas sp. UPD001]MBL0965599.1 TonB-dependent receptor [Blastomonas sp.]